MTTSYTVDAEGGDEEDLSPPLVSEDEAHDWAAVNRRGRAYRIQVSEDGEPAGEPRQFPPRPT